MAGFYNLRLRIGPDVSSELLTRLAQLAAIYGGGYMRFEQGVEIPAVPEQVLEELQLKLKHAGVAFTTAGCELFDAGGGI